MIIDDERPLADTGQPGDRFTEDEGLVERLLHAAGPGPEVPADGAERVKELIRAHWQEEASVRTRQRRLLLAGGLTAAAAIIVAAVFLPSLRRVTPVPTQRGVIVALLDGAMEVAPPGSRVRILDPADTGSEIPHGSFVRTLPGCRVALQLTETRSIRLDKNTEVRLDSEASIALESGAVYISSSDEAGLGIEVRTALGTAYDIGTQFEVRFTTDSLDVKVREGLVSLARGGEEFEITQGFTFSVDSDGALSTGTITSYDPAWSWTQEIAPAFEIEGQTVLAFLDWVSHETGLSVRFENVDAELLAEVTTLHGSIEGLTPTQAPAVILPSARLTASEERGGMIIRVLESNNEGFEELPLK